MQTRRLDTFQSAPAIAGGRCCWGSGRRCSARCFNPRPPLLAGDASLGFGFVTFAALFQSAPAIAGGRCAVHIGGFQRGKAVSIRARHCWRAMPHIGDRDRQRGCFNPRPPLLAGDAAGDSYRRGLLQVSIRARHCWRAMLVQHRREVEGLMVSIRARHCWRAMP